MFFYFTLSLNINCSRKQQKLEIKQGLHSLRLERSLVCKILNIAQFHIVQQLEWSIGPVLIWISVDMADFHLLSVSLNSICTFEFPFPVSKKNNLEKDE